VPRSTFAVARALYEHANPRCYRIRTALERVLYLRRRRPSRDPVADPLNQANSSNPALYQEVGFAPLFRGGSLWENSRRLWTNRREAAQRPMRLTRFRLRFAENA